MSFEIEKDLVKKLNKHGLNLLVDNERGENRYTIADENQIEINDCWTNIPLEEVESFVIIKESNEAGKMMNDFNENALVPEFNMWCVGYVLSIIRRNLPCNLDARYLRERVFNPADEMYQGEDEHTRERKTYSVEYILKNILSKTVGGMSCGKEYKYKIDTMYACVYNEFFRYYEAVFDEINYHLVSEKLKSDNDFIFDEMYFAKLDAFDECVQKTFDVIGVDGIKAYIMDIVRSQRKQGGQDM